jgi:hypothetical protein
VRAGLCAVPKEYLYSPAKFYYDGANSFGMLKHYSGNKVWLYNTVGQETRGLRGLEKRFKFENGTPTKAKFLSGSKFYSKE